MSENIGDSVFIVEKAIQNSLGQMKEETVVVDEKRVTVLFLYNLTFNVQVCSRLLDEPCPTDRDVILYLYFVKMIIPIDKTPTSKPCDAVFGKVRAESGVLPESLLAQFDKTMLGETMTALIRKGLCNALKAYGV